MKRITIKVSDGTFAALRELASACSEVDKFRQGFTSHGKLTPASVKAELPGEST